jgi:Flp pilus assembly protein TadG
MISGHRIGRRRRQGGNALIEFSMMAIVLFLFCAGVSDFARLVTVGRLATGAAMAGAYYGALGPEHYNDLQGVHDAAIKNTNNYSGATATVTQFFACSVGGAQVASPDSCAAGSNPETYIQVVVTLPYTSLFKFPWVPDPINISQLQVIRVR